MTEFPYDATKATQAAAWLVARAGGRMSHIRLSKLLYIADREALRKWGRPIIGGSYCSMEHGPVISPVVDCLKKPEQRAPRPIWDEHLQRQGNFIQLIADPGRGQLHEAAVQLLEAIFNKCKTLTKWEVRDMTHKFPEYKNPGKSSRPIATEEVLKAVERTDEEIELLATDSRHLRKIKRLIGC
jgi:uncharacterized phage-associated protein